MKGSHARNHIIRLMCSITLELTIIGRDETEKLGITKTQYSQLQNLSVYTTKNNDLEI